ncbi:competence/damage-inducible protein A [Clostridium sp. MSJ-11]|uniref:Putative competence-damage inducible protein n=1 Tax=Clostridium mobile TaxID=2841512 RepID=A0ABS6ELG5_9CLOT|nr:competence/damage-inducible protein A [Clostridium mobile]MBU5486059.1 competence/damage-inducible protein A [Clostridium mobile]
MIAEIISIGTEILLGDILNTNAEYLSKRLANLGVYLYHQSVVGDNAKRLEDELERAFSRSDLVITTGGLGPTKDDLTKEIGAEYFNISMELHEESYIKLTEYFKKQNRELTENNIKQAYFPVGSIILPNHFGTAPGCIINKNDKILILLPGPPKENIPMFENYVVPYINKLSNNTLISKTLRICGMGESMVATKINNIIDNQSNPTVAPYAKDNEVTLRITAKANNKEEGEKLIAPVENEIRNILGDNIYGINEDTLEGVVGEILIENNLTISVAESCTGGLLCGKLVNYPGISKVLIEGCVTYSNSSKMKRLGVSKSTLDKFGAVSEETAKEMAEGIAKASNSNIGISVTGIAGPDGGTTEKPVGLVYVGIYINGETFVKKLHLSGNRQTVRERTVTFALDWLRRLLSKISL